MYLSILALPMFGSAVAGLFGRKVGVTGAHIITTGCLSISAVLAIVAFYEVGLCGSPVSIELFSWIDSEFMLVQWGFLFDSLTVSMLLPVLIVSSLVHLYSISYIAEDPHNQRFFSYLSMFTFFMLILVAGDNYFIMFIGWEGKLLALNGLYEYPNESLAIVSTITKNNVNNLSIKYFHTNKKIPSNMRIGPHNLDVIQVLVGSLLGDAHLEKRGEGVRAKFEQTNRNVEYLMWFHNFFALRGYCSETKPKLFKRIKKNNFVYHGYKFSTYSFSSLTLLYDAFYTNKVKHLPLILLQQELTPMSLAIWFMDDGSLLGKGYKIATNCFEKQELEGLCLLLFKKYGLVCTLHKDGSDYSIYIKSTSAKLFSELVKPHIIESIKYKLGEKP
jgi:hypothetical protein